MLDPGLILRQLFDASVVASSDFTGLGGDLEPVRGRVVVMALGKAAPAMAHGFADSLPSWLEPSRVEGHVVQQACSPVNPVPEGWQSLHGDHPLPGPASLQAGRRLLDVAASLGSEDLLVVLVSGGGSAMAAVPRGGLTLEDKTRTGKWLLDSGRPISELNAVRSALSAFKGGGLARAAAPARIATFILSDVPGDAPWRVASGPSLVSRDALPALSDDELSQLPARVRRLVGHLLRKQGRPDGTPPPETSPVDELVFMVGSGDTALAAAATLARRHGLAVVNLGAGIEGEAQDVARLQAKTALSLAGQGQASVLLSGGETTVRLENAGRGGRNAEYALALAIALEGHPAVHALAADTDGIDGKGPPAGAFIHPDTLGRLARLDLDAEAILASHDTHPAFEALGDALVTGPTGTNVNDFRAVLILPAPT